MFKIDELLKAGGGRFSQSGRINAVKAISIDSRTIHPGEAFVAIKGDNFDGHDFIDLALKKGANCIIKNKGAKSPKEKNIAVIEVGDTVKALGGIARFQRLKFGNIPLIAVSGSSGKTTAKEMVAWVLAKKFKVLKNEGTKNNQIGLSLSLLNLDRAHEAAVLELGTNHPGEISYLAKICLPNIAVITNIGPAHLEYFHDLDGVLSEKYSLIKNLRKPYISILNADDRFLREKALKKTNNPFTLSFGINQPADFSASNIKGLKKGLEFLINRKYKFTLNTLGRYNIYNVLSAVSVARLFSISYSDIAGRLADFNFPKGRLNFVELNRIKFIDDTYNSNPLSLKEALIALNGIKGVKGRKIVIMGDMLELGAQKKLFHYQAGRDISQICDIFISVGELSMAAAQAAKKCGLGANNIFACDTSAQARQLLFNKISVNKDDIVLVKGSRLMKMEEVFQRRPCE